MTTAVRLAAPVAMDKCASPVNVSVPHNAMGRTAETTAVAGHVASAPPINTRSAVATTSAIAHRIASRLSAVMTVAAVLAESADLVGHASSGSATICRKLRVAAAMAQALIHLGQCTGGAAAGHRLAEPHLLLWISVGATNLTGTR